MSTTWNKISKATGTSWTKISKVLDSGSLGTAGVPMGLLLAITYGVNSPGTTWNKIIKASGTAWNKITKAT